MDRPLPPANRTKLEAITGDLLRLQFETGEMGDEFLAFLIGAAADHARDELRDDKILRSELETSSSYPDLRGEAG